MLSFKGILRAKRFVAGVLSTAILLAAGCAEPRPAQPEAGLQASGSRPGVGGAWLARSSAREPASL